MIDCGRITSLVVVIASEAKQSKPSSGLLRRCAPRNDAGKMADLDSSKERRSAGQTVLVVADDIVGGARIEVRQIGTASADLEDLIGKVAIPSRTPNPLQALFRGSPDDSGDGLPGQCSKLAE